MNSFRLPNFKKIIVNTFFCNSCNTDRKMPSSTILADTITIISSSLMASSSGRLNWSRIYRYNWFCNLMPILVVRKPFLVDAHYRMFWDKTFARYGKRESHFILTLTHFCEDPCVHKDFRVIRMTLVWFLVVITWTFECRNAFSQI